MSDPTLVDLEHIPLETVPTASLKPHPRNYQDHPDDQLDHLGESLREHGQYKPVVVARDGTVLAGHGVWLAHRRERLAHIEVRRMPYEPDEPRALRLLAGDNLIGQLALRDDRLTAELLSDLRDADPDGLLGTGFDADLLATLSAAGDASPSLGGLGGRAPGAGASHPAPPSLLLRFRAREDQARCLELLELDDTDDLTDEYWWPADPDGPS